MEPALLIDSNALIDYLGGKLPVAAANWLEQVFQYETYHVSVITRIEVMSFQADPQATRDMLDLVENAQEVGLEEPIIQRTIVLRQQHRMKLPDALIAATALVHGLLLVTRNLADFQNIPGLAVLNPHAAAPLPPLP